MASKKSTPKDKAIFAPDEQTFRLLFENHPIPMWVYDLKTLTFLEVNDAALEKYGYTHDEFLTLTTKDIRPAEDVARPINHLEQKRPALQRSGERRHRLKNGQIIDVEITSHTLKFEGHEAALVMAQDITEHKQAENILRQSEERYRLLFDRMADGLYRSTHEGKFVDVNPAMIKMFGYASKEEMLKVDIKKDLYFAPEERGSHILDTGQEETESYRMRRKDGSEIWVEDHGLYVHDEQGNIIFHEGMLRDITERKMAEESLAASEAELRALFASMQDVVLVIDRNGVYRKIAPTNPGLLVKPPDELLGENLRDIFPSEQAETLISTIQLVLEKQQISYIEYELTIGEQKMWFATSISPMDHESTLWVARDITRRKHDEEESLLQSAALNVAANAIVITNRDGTIEWVNPAFSALTGYTLEEAVSKNPRQLIRSGLLDRAFYKSMWDTILSGEVWHGELTNRRKDGSLYNEEQTITPMKNADGKISHFIAIKQDITERKQAEEALRENEEKYRRLFDNANLGIFQSTPEGKAILVNYAFAHMFGYNSPEDAIKSIKNVAIDVFADPNRRAEIIRLMAENPDLRTFENLYRRKDGSTFVGSLNTMPIKDSEGSLTRIEGIIEDITARTQAETARERLLQELTSLHAIASACAFANDEDSLLTVASRIIGEVLYPEDFGFFMADKTGLLRPHPSYHQKNGTPNEFIRPGDGLIGQAAQEGKARRSGDVRQEKNYIAASPTSLSELAVPVKIKERVLGVINAESNKLNAFSEADERLLSTAADQIATALERIRLQYETVQRAREFASLYETSNALSAENDLTALLQAIVEHAAALLNASNGGMYLFNKPAQDLETVVATSSDIHIGTHLRLGEGVAGRVAQTQLPMRVDDYSTWESRSPKYDGQIFRAILEVPILFGGELIGVLTAAEVGESRRKFTEADERLLSLFAAQAAGAIHSARLREETVRRAREFASLYETSNALSTENELNSMLQVIVEHAKKLLGSVSSGMYLYLSETDELELTVDTKSYIPLGTRIRLGEGVAGRVAQTHQPLRIDDYSTWEGRSPVYDGASIRAVLEVPMLYGGELIGVLTADEVADSERKFTETDERLLSLFASQAAGAIHSARLREQTASRLDQLQALHVIDRAISSSFDLRPIINVVISQTLAQLGCDAADVLLFHPHLQTLEYVAGQGFHTHAIKKTHLRLGEGHAGRAAFERRTIHVPDLSETGSNFTRASLLEGEGFLEYYAVPLIAKGEIKGVLEVFHRTSLPPNSEWLDFLETLAGQAAIAIDQTQLFDDLQRANLELIIAYDATIEGWSHAMDLRDKETEGHTLRVTEMTMALAKAMGINEKEMLHIRRGALLHDIGKMGVPDNILFKEGKLTDEEWVIMRQHPTFSYKMLHPIKYLQQSLDIPYCHHEKWDGTGYPRGLKGEQIPLVARIFAVIDVWDAVTIDRPYRKAWTKQKALKHIREQSGKYFDPEVVKTFLKLFDTKITGPSRKSTPSNKPSQRSARK